MQKFLCRKTIEFTKNCICFFFLVLFRCVTLSDLTGDGDSKLVVADLGSGNYNMKLRVYKGTQLVNDTKKLQGVQIQKFSKKYLSTLCICFIREILILDTLYNCLRIRNKTYLWLFLLEQRWGLRNICKGFFALGWKRNAFERGSKMLMLFGKANKLLIFSIFQL